MIHKASRNLLGALRDLHTLRAWIADGDRSVPISEVVSVVHRFDRSLDVWASHGSPDAGESLELEGSA